MIRFSDLIDLWVIEIKSPCSFVHVVRRELTCDQAPLPLPPQQKKSRFCLEFLWRKRRAWSQVSQEWQSTKHRSSSENMQKVCVFYSYMPITRLDDYQTWSTDCWRDSRGAQRHAGFFSWLCFLLIGWADKLRSLEICRINVNQVAACCRL